MIDQSDFRFTIHLLNVTVLLIESFFKKIDFKANNLFFAIINEISKISFSVIYEFAITRT